MKYLMLTFVFIVSYTTVSAQQTTGTNDALLLDYYQNQRFAEAADYLKKLYPEPVTDVKALAKLAYTSQMASRFIDAEDYYQRVYTADSANTAALFNLGAINLRRGNYKMAEMYYKIISKKDSSNFMVFKQLGNIADNNGDIKSMLIYLEKANKLNPNDADVAADLSDSYVIFKRYNEAEKVLNTAIATDPQNMILLQSLLKLTWSQKKYTSVKDVCLKLIAAGNTSSIVLTRLEVAYYNLKDYTCCVETNASIAEPDFTETSCYTAALAYKMLKDQPSAIRNIIKAIEIGISPNISDYYAEMADSYTVLKKYKQAMPAYQKALQFKESPLIYYLMATVYDDNIRNKKLAIKYYKKFTACKLTLQQKKYKDYAISRIKTLTLH